MNSLVGEYFNTVHGSYDEDQEKVELSYDVFEYFAPENYSGSFDTR